MQTIPSTKESEMLVNVISIIRPNFDLACSLHLQTEPQQNHQNSK